MGFNSAFKGLITESLCATFVILHKSHTELIAGQSSLHRKIAFELMLARFVLKISRIRKFRGKESKKS